MIGMAAAKEEGNYFKKERSRKSMKKFGKVLGIVVIMAAAVICCVPWLRDKVGEGIDFLKEEWRERHSW